MDKIKPPILFQPWLLAPITNFNFFLDVLQVGTHASLCEIKLALIRRCKIGARFDFIITIRSVGLPPARWTNDLKRVAGSAWMAKTGARSCGVPWGRPTSSSGLQ